MSTVYTVDSDIELQPDEESEEEIPINTTSALEDEALSPGQRILHLPFDPVWIYSLLILSCIQINVTLYCAGIKKYGTDSVIADHNFSVLSYICDVMYCVDIFLIIICKNMHGLFISPSSIRLPNAILVMDALSLVPTEFLIPMNPITPLKARLFYIVQLNNCLKLGRIYYIMYQNHKMVGINKKTWQFFEFFYNMSMGIIVGFSLTYNIVYFSSNYSNEQLSSANYTELFYIAVSKVTTKGFTEYPYNLHWMFWLTIAGYVQLIGIIYLNISYLTLIKSASCHHKYLFINKLAAIQKQIKALGVSETLINKSGEYFNIFWNKHRGHERNLKFLSQLPLVMRKEIALDTCWFALKHSRLFRDMDLPFLRHVSLFIKSEFSLAGEILYDKDIVKDKMIYVTSGVVQILSEEDGETPILSFSGGTCLGESSLMLSYTTTATLRCKTFCQLQILTRKDFVKIIKIFPKKFLRLRKDFKERLLLAEEYHNFSNIINIGEGADDRTDLTIMMLKSTLHRLMIKDGDTSSKHECQNIFLRSEFDEQRFKSKHFSATYLDMLAISERLQLVTDSVFLKTSCPCILQPDSVILNIWEVIITIVAVGIAFMVPYFAFVEPSMPDWYKCGIFATTVLWWIDIYIQVSIAVKTADEIIATVKDIFVYRMNTASFVIEVVAAAPLEILSCIVLPINTYQTMAMLQLNRTLKLWRIRKILEKWEIGLHNNAILIRYFNHCGSFIYLIFVSSCVLYSSNCFNFLCKEKISEEGPVIQLIWYILFVTQILTGASVSSVYSGKQIYFSVYILLTIISLVLYVTVQSNIAGIYVVRYLREIKVREIVDDTINMMHTYRLTFKYRSRILNYVEAQCLDNYAMKLFYHKSLIVEMPVCIHDPLKEEMFAKLILTIPIFKDLPKELILDLCLVAVNTILPPNEVICYAGEVSESFFIIRMGYCKIACNITDIKEKMFGPGDDISVIETCLHVPVVNTIVTVTHCKLVLINYEDFMKVLVKYPRHKKELETEFAQIKTEDQFSFFFRAKPFDTNYTLPVQNERKASFRKFGYNLKIDSFEEYDYYVPFDRLDYFSFVQYFLLRYTILPDSTFLFKWEISRCLCAFLSAILFCLPSISVCLDCEWTFLLIFLDAMAWFDMYVRLHICYYNENGLLITHPLKTATNYLRRGFLIDFLGVLPVHLFLPISKNNKTLAILLLSRVLQMHRYYGFFEYVRNNYSVSTAVLILFKYIPMLLVLCNFIGALLVNYACTINGRNVHCIKLWTIKFEKPFSRTFNQAMAVYIVSSILTQSGMLGFMTTFDITAIIVAFLAIVGYVISLHITSTIIAQHTSIDSTLLIYQDSAKSVRTFMQQYNVSIELQRQLIAHFQLKWQRKQGKDIRECIYLFNSTLQQDILYDVYGAVLENKWIFFSDSKALLRKLLPKVSHDIIMAKGYIASVNDVNKYLHILYKGNVDVFAADSTKLITLTVGSMFGNLDDCTMARQMVSVVASGHVEILTIESLHFHALLNKYPRLQKRYKFLTAVHVDYLEGQDSVTGEHKSVVGSINVKKTRIKIFFPAIFNKVFNPKSTSIRIWRIFILVLVCYIDVWFGIYQMAMATYPLIAIIFHYLCDLLFLINYYVKTHTAFEDKFGVMIADLKMINARMRLNRIYYWLEIISLIPLDILIWPLPLSFGTFRIIYPIFRSNRILRFVCIITFFKEQRVKVDISIFNLQLLYSIIWSFMLLHFFTCFLIALACTHTHNMYPPIDCAHTFTSFLEGLRVYLRNFYTVFSCLSGSSQELSFPISWILMAYFAFLMNCLKVISAILMAHIYSALQKTYSNQIKYDRYLYETIDVVLKRENLSYVILARIENYFKLIWRYHRGTTFPTFLSEAPAYLREAVLNNAFSYHINKHFLFEQCHIDFNRQIVGCLTNATYFRRDYILFKGAVNRNMYFVHSGSVIVADEDSFHNETIVGVLTSGMNFGIPQGLGEEIPFTYSFRAAERTVILTLDFNTWKHLLDFYPASKCILYDRYSQYEDTYT